MTVFTPQMIHFPFNCLGAPLVSVQSLIEVTPRVMASLAKVDGYHLQQQMMNDLDIPSSLHGTAIFQMMVGYSLSHPFEKSVPASLSSLDPLRIEFGIGGEGSFGELASSPFLDGVRRAVLDGETDPKTIFEAGLARSEREKNRVG